MQVRLNPGPLSPVLRGAPGPVPLTNTGKSNWLRLSSRRLESAPSRIAYSREGRAEKPEGGGFGDKPCLRSQELTTGEAASPPRTDGLVTRGGSHLESHLITWIGTLRPSNVCHNTLIMHMAPPPGIEPGSSA